MIRPIQIKIVELFDAGVIEVYVDYSVIVGLLQALYLCSKQKDLIYSLSI
jgi:hypothetical protein